MVKKHLIFIIVLFPVFFSSCVSKKKFMEMQNGRIQAEEQLRQTTAESNARAERIKTMIADFESMKNELMASNAEKDQYIDNLNKEIAGLSEQLKEQKKSIQESSFTFGFERERYTENLQEKEKAIRSLQREMAEMEKEMSQQASTLSDRNVRISSLTDQLQALEGERIRSEKQLNELQQQLGKLRDETNSLNALIKEKDETITRLQNNVNLLKREIGERN
jgi:chromosome segregation ATPase